MSDIPVERAGIASRLATARKHAGLSQGQVAKMLEIPRPSVSEMEAGRRKVSAEEVKHLADIYEVDVAWLLNGAKENTDPAFELAARDLSRLREEDLDKVIGLLRTLRKGAKP